MGEGVVAQSGGSNSRGPWFESSHWGKYIMNTFTVSVENTKMSNERPGMELNEHNIFFFLTQHLTIRAAFLLFSSNLLISSIAQHTCPTFCLLRRLQETEQLVTYCVPVVAILINTLR